MSERAYATDERYRGRDERRRELTTRPRLTQKNATHETQPQRKGERVDKKTFLVIDDFGCTGTRDNQLPRQAVNEAIADSPAAAVNSLLQNPLVLEELATNNQRVVRVGTIGGRSLLVTVVRLD